MIAEDGSVTIAT